MKVKLSFSQEIASSDEAIAIQSNLQGLYPTAEIRGFIVGLISQEKEINEKVKTPMEAPQ